MKILVTGGTGFIGKALVKALVGKDHAVSVLALEDDPELQRLGIRRTVGDIADAKAVTGAVEGHDAVFHTAARTGTAGRYRDFYEPNVLGTKNVLEACRQCGVKHLIYTGSPSAVFSGRPIEGLAEDQCTYPSRFLSHYEKTKAIAEQLVAAAGRNLDACPRTVIVRPHLVYGPGDTNLLPRLEARAAAGRLVQVGDGSNLVSLTHIDNAVRGHIRALESLADNAGLSGSVYFITDGPPVNLWDWIRAYLQREGLPGPARKMSHRTAYALGGILEAVWKVAGIRRAEPPLTRFVAGQLAMSHYYAIEKARRELGYEPAAAGCVAHQLL